MTTTDKRTPGSNDDLDLLIHEASRLKIIAVLAECESADFTFIHMATGLTRGNLSVHARKLVDAGYIDECKEFVNRRPKTTYRLTGVGKEAFAAYKVTLKKIAGL